jgi:dephospho-CoA kinase
MLKIGLTGGIGSGKTTIAQVFEVLGIPVYYADLAAKHLMNQDPELKKQIIASFGEETYKDDMLDRACLAEKVFGDAEKLARLNAIVHPATLRDAEAWMKNQKTHYAIKEAALIFEAGLEKYFDYIIGVTAPESIRLFRVQQRDHSSTEEIMQRMTQQMNEKEKISLCDFVIINDGMQAVVPQVLFIHETLMGR